MAQAPGTVYRFGPFQFDSGQRVLYCEGEPVPLVPKAADTLQALLERRGQVVSKAELMKAVWPDCVVEDVGLARNISLLRKALGDHAEAYIETIPKRGYRFTADAGATPHMNEPIGRKAELVSRKWLALIVLLGAGGVVVWQFYWPSRYLPRRQAALAVVPFKCLTADLQRTTFAEALAEAVAQEVSKLESVQVMSPSTVERYQRLMIPTAIMSRVLGLQVVVEGTVQTVGQHIRISVRLTDVHSGKLIWAEAYTIPAADSGEAQVDIATKIAAQIGRCLSAR